MDLLRYVWLVSAFMLVRPSVLVDAYQCVTDQKFGSISQGAIKGLTVDVESLQFCADQLQPIWPNSISSLRVLRLPQVWKSSWSSDGRSTALAHLQTLLDETDASVLVGVPITCDGADDAVIWQYTQAFLSELSPSRVAGLAIGEEVDVVASSEVKNASACKQRLWENGQFWRNFTDIVAKFDSLGFSSIPITTIFSPTALVGSPFAETSGEVRAKSFLQNATRKYGTRFAFSFNSKSFTEMMPTATSACANSLSLARCWGTSCSVPSQLQTIRQKMQALTSSTSYELWATEVGWSIDNDNFAEDAEPVCSAWASTANMKSFYTGFLNWDGSIGSTYKAPELVFWSAMRGGSERFPSSGLVPSCDSRRCSIHSDDFVLFQVSLYSGPAKAYCADSTLFNDWVMGEEACQRKCKFLDDCWYASVWPEWHYDMHWCRLTTTCATTEVADTLVSIYIKEQVEEVPDPLPILKPTTTSTVTTVTRTTTTITKTTTSTMTSTTRTSTSTTRTSTTVTTTTRTTTTTTISTTTKTQTVTSTTKTQTVTSTTTTQTTTTRTVTTTSTTKTQTTTQTTTSTTKTVTTTSTTKTATTTTTTTGTTTTRTLTTTSKTGTSTTATSSTTTGTTTTTTTTTSSTRTQTSTTVTTTSTVTTLTSTTTTTSTTITRVACEFENEPSIGYYWDTSCRMGDLGCNADGLSVQCRFCGSGDFKNVSCPASLCTFPNEPVIPYYWDGDCELGELGCWADGIHPQCRFCGDKPYTSIDCPDHAQVSETLACAFQEEPAYPYYWEPQCVEGLLGCTADGSHLSCRFCGAGPYEGISCPKGDACTFLNPPALPAYWEDDCEMGVLGCLADGINVKCRFCGHRPFENITCPEELAPPKNQCHFPEGSIPTTPYFWDASCEMGKLGCWADGIHAECRFCGEGPYRDVSCPVGDDASEPTTLSFTEKQSREHRSSSSQIAEKNMDIDPEEYEKVEPEETLSGARGLRYTSMFIFCLATCLPPFLA